MVVVVGVAGREKDKVLLHTVEKSLVFVEDSAMS